MLFEKRTGGLTKIKPMSFEQKGEKRSFQKVLLVRIITMK